VYGSAKSEVLLASLDLIQNRALRTCCGAMKCTPTAAMHVERRVMPLALHRLALQTRFAIKVKATPGHVANTMFKAHWTNAYMARRREFLGNRVSIAVKTEQFFVSHPRVALVAQGPDWLQIRAFNRPSIYWSINLKKFD